MSVVVVSASGLETKSHSFKAWFTTSTLIDQGMYDNNGPFVWSQEGKLNLAYWDTTCISILSIACWPKFCSPLLVLSCFWFAPHWRFQLVQKFVKLSHSNFASNHYMKKFSFSSNFVGSPLTNDLIPSYYRLESDLVTGQ